MCVSVSVCVCVRLCVWFVCVCVCVCDPVGVVSLYWESGALSASPFTSCQDSRSPDLSVLSPPPDFLGTAFPVHSASFPPQSSSSVILHKLEQWIRLYLWFDEWCFDWELWPWWFPRVTWRMSRLIPSSASWGLLQCWVRRLCLQPLPMPGTRNS